MALVDYPGEDTAACAPMSCQDLAQHVLSLLNDAHNVLSQMGIFDTPSPLTNEKRAERAGVEESLQDLRRSAEALQAKLENLRNRLGHL